MQLQRSAENEQKINSSKCLNLSQQGRNNCQRIARNQGDQNDHEAPFVAGENIPLENDGDSLFTTSGECWQITSTTTQPISAEIRKL